MLEKVDWLIVVPCHNEALNIPLLVSQLRQSFASHDRNHWNILFVDDGSSDSSWACIEQMNSEDSRVLGVGHSRNFGHQRALTTGLSFADANYVGIMDCDLQDPVEEMFKMFDLAESESLDVCYGVRRTRVEPLMLKFCYRAFYRILNSVAERPWPLDAGDFCVMSRRAKDSICSMPERERILRGMRAWIGLKQKAHPYDRAGRNAGVSNYRFFDLLNLARRSIIGFSVAPLRIASFLAILFSGGALIILLLIVLNRFFPQVTILGYNIGSNAGAMTIISIVSLSGAATMFCLGIIGEYLALIYEELKRRPVALVSRKIGAISDRQTSASDLVLDLL